MENNKESPIIDLLGLSELFPKEQPVPIAGKNVDGKNLGYVSNPLDEMLSKYWTLANLTVTNHNIDNTPTAAELKNLKWLAGMADEVYDQVGPYQILSAYRSKALQDALREEGEPAATKKSFHEAGMALDLTPTTMSLNDFFNKLLSSFKDKLGEISIKPGQNAIHISMPTDSTQGKVLVLNEAGKYVAMAANEIEDRISSVINFLSDSVDEYATPALAKVPIPLVLAALAGLFIFFRRPKKVS